MKGTFKKWHELEDGDIFWCDPDINLNYDGEWHEDLLLSGKDQIFIKDDFVELEEDFSGSLLVNGGFTVYFTPNCTAYVLGHYSELLNNIKHD